MRLRILRARFFEHHSSHGTVMEIAQWRELHLGVVLHGFSPEGLHAATASERHSELNNRILNPGSTIDCGLSRSAKRPRPIERIELHAVGSKLSCRCCEGRAFREQLALRTLAISS